MDEKAGNQTATTGLTTFSGGIVMTATDNTFRPPKLTKLQIHFLTPIAGDVVYSTEDNNPAFYNGTEWRVLSNTVWIPPLLPISTPSFTGSTTGNYTASASSQNPAAGTLFAWYAFNQNTGNPGWASLTTPATYAVGTGLAVSGQGELGGITGSWVKLYTTTSVVVSSLNFSVNISTEEPRRWYVLYSNDNATWATADSTYSATDFNSYSPGTGVSTTGVRTFPSPVTC